MKSKAVAVGAFQNAPRQRGAMKLFGKPFNRLMPPKDEMAGLPALVQSKLPPPSYKGVSEYVPDEDLAEQLKLVKQDLLGMEGKLTGPTRSHYRSEVSRPPLNNVEYPHWSKSIAPSPGYYEASADVAAEARRSSAAGSAARSAPGAVPLGSVGNSETALSVSERRDRAVARVAASLERRSNAQANAADCAADEIRASNRNDTERVGLPSKNEVIHSNYVGPKAHKNFFQLYSEVQRERLLCYGGTVPRGTDPADDDRASLADDASSVVTSALHLSDGVT